MQNIVATNKKFDYDLRNYFDLDNQEGPEEYFQIKDFVLSPNSQLIAIVVTRSEHKATCYSLYEYLIDIFDIESNTKIIQGEWLDSDFSFSVFSQFSQDSQYFVYHSKETLNIINLKTLDSESYDEIDSILSIDENNQIYLLKQQKLQIYQIENSNFIQIINIEFDAFICLQKIQSNLYFLVDDSLRIKWIDFFTGKSFNKQFQIDDTYEDDTHQIMGNFLICSYFFLKQYIQLRSLKNFKLLRSIKQEESDVLIKINDQNNFQVIKALLDDENMTQNIIRFNMIKGISTSVKFDNQLVSDQKVYMTSSILVMIDHNSEKLSYFIINPGNN